MGKFTLLKISLPLLFISLVGCGASPVEPEAESQSESATLVSAAHLWTCTSRGRTETSAWVLADGVGATEAAAKQASLAACGAQATACYLVACHPGA